ncbi:hypothetical protein HBB16_17770 [Pseudonocardia sp. MCCB 268]|nr:hypothetical protein [Pseudonocardia cytotoxica]
MSLAPGAGDGAERASPGRADIMFESSRSLRPYLVAVSHERVQPRRAPGGGAVDSALVVVCLTFSNT